MRNFDLQRTTLPVGTSVIEASAGTGKTWTIAHLVPRLLVDGVIKNIGEILLVTFTEDAARELGDRTRRQLATLVNCLELDISPGKDEPGITQLLDRIAALGEAVDSQSCLDCHCFLNDEGGMAPDLSNYGSLDWLTSFIADPEQERFYGYDSEMNDRMPSFARHPHDPKLNLLTRREIDLIARWLRGDDRDLATSHLREQLAP